MLRSSLGALLAGAVLATSFAAPALAQSTSPTDPFNPYVRDVIVGSSANPELTGLSTEVLLDSMTELGFDTRPFPERFVGYSKNYPITTDPSITETAIVEKREEGPRLERWIIASPAMQRNVEVQIMRAADPNAPAPLLYMLDGVDGSANSGWVRNGAAEQVWAEENVTVVMPTQALASMYSDWVSDDPALGRHQWETFITEELDPLLSTQEELNFNGKRGIGGLSMGAAGAVHIANAHPELFDATIGISSCYSTMDATGRQMAHAVVGRNGGDVENMWGPFGSEEWKRHDVVANPEGLRDMAVYLSAANGVFREGDADSYAYYGGTNMVLALGVILEQGSLSCTQNLEQAMIDRGMDHQVVEYQETGAHNWPLFNRQLQPAWDAIKHALYQDAPAP